MSFHEEVAVDEIVNVEGPMDGDEDAGEAISKASESPQGLALQLDSEDVEGENGAKESDEKSAKLDPPDPSPPAESTPPADSTPPTGPAETPEHALPAEVMEPLALGEGKNESESNELERKEGSEGALIANGSSTSKPEEPAENLAASLESDGVTILPHWHAKPCVHITGLGGVASEEDLLPMLTPHGKVASVVFENERKDSAIVRFELSGTDGDEVVKRVHEALHNKQVKKRTVLVELFRSDSLLFIGNLTPEITDTVLRQMFEPHGTVERAFVLRNAAGRSKGYGFVEYSLKYQANAAKVAMGNINMDGRVLRVEWSDCRKISDMFSTVLFVDRIAKDVPHIEQSLRDAFGMFGRVRDCHLAVGMNQQLRGFGFIDFYHSTCADRAHEALDGQVVEGSSIRVSFANPSKSAQSYKTRFGIQAAMQASNNHSRGSYQDRATWPSAPAAGASMRSHTNAPAVGNRYMTQARSNMLGMNTGMQFGRGAPFGAGMIGRNLVSSLVPNGPGMLGPGAVAGGMMGRASAVMLGHGGQRGGVPGGYGQQGSRLLTGRGPLPITPATIAQGASAQARAREEEAKARAEVHVKQLHAGVSKSSAEQERVEQFRKMAAQQAQLLPQQKYHHQQVASVGLAQQPKPSGVQYAPQQAYRQTGHAQTVQYQHQPAAQQGSDTQQAQHSHQSYGAQYLLQPVQQYGQLAQQSQQSQQQQQPQSQPSGQLQVSQPQQQQQQSTDQAAVTTQQQYAQYAQQYGQQFAQQYAQQLQQSVQPYSQQLTAQQYGEASQAQTAAQHNQQDYASYYAQQQQPQSQQAQAVGAATPTGGTIVQSADASQQQAYAAYYQQKAQEAVAQAGTSTAQTAASVAGSASSGSTAVGLEAQWAAYYAVQAAHQQAGTTPAATTTYDQQQPGYNAQQSYATAYYQQPVPVDVGQKRTADQSNYTTQAQTGYGYQQQSSAVPASYTQHQQVVNGITPGQQQTATAATLHQQPSTTGSTYQQALLASYQQPSVGYQQPTTAVPMYSPQTPASGYTPVVASGYQQLATPAPSGYQQSLAPSAGMYQQQPSSGLASNYSQPNQAVAAAPGYDYNKRTRY